MGYEAVIGLEVHAQLLTDSKLFCGCSAKFGADPNSQTCPVCLGMPGVLPVLNRKVVEFAVRLGIATHCRISSSSQLARKNYFYPDLPKGYQISMYESPIAVGGHLEIKKGDAPKRIGITRIHMEEDAGKNIHDEAVTGGKWSFVDLNRASVPLLEIVSEPDMNTPEEAVQYLKKLRGIVMYLGICDGNMEEGSFRCDANISVRPRGDVKLGVKTELKNINSFKFIERALIYEIERQIETLKKGERITQDTRLFDSKKGVTYSMRTKEYAHDYRYFPEPDLLPLIMDEKWIEEIKSTLPELPDDKYGRFIKEYQLPDYDVGIITSTRVLADYFEECVKLFPKPKMVSNWIMTEVLRVAKKENDIGEISIEPRDLIELFKLIDNGAISLNMAKEVFEEAYNTGTKPLQIVERKGVSQISDADSLKTIIAEVVKNHPDQVNQYLSGKDKVLGFLVGRVMKASGGRANPQKVNELLQKYLKGGQQA